MKKLVLALIVANTVFAATSVAAAHAGPGVPPAQVATTASGDISLPLETVASEPLVCAAASYVHALPPRSGEVTRATGLSAPTSPARHAPRRVVYTFSPDVIVVAEHPTVATVPAVE